MNGRVAARLFSIALAGLLATFWQAATYAQNEPGDSVGVIGIDSATLVRSSQGWALAASAEIQLSRQTRKGLDSGVPLEFVLRFSVTEPRMLLPDRALLKVERRYSLIYYELTRHYRLQSLDTGGSRNFRSLLPALDALGDIRESGKLPVAMQNQPGTATQQVLSGRLRIMLDGRALPLPLQSLFSSAWRLASEEYVWQLN